MINPRKYQSDREDVLDWLKLLTRTTVPFRELFSQAKIANRLNIQIPEELTKAWLHLVMSLAFVAVDMQYFDEQMVLCNQLIEVGIRNLVHNMSLNRLSDYATFVPAELASFITFQLAQYVKMSLLVWNITEILRKFFGSTNPRLSPLVLQTSLGSENPFISMLTL